MSVTVSRKAEANSATPLRMGESFLADLRASKRTIACFPSSGRCSSRARRVVSISCIWSPTKCKRAASSASVFGGGGVRSGVRNLSSCADALRDARALADEALALSVRPFGVFLR